jgi:hypothetical protein
LSLLLPAIRHSFVSQKESESSESSESIEASESSAKHQIDVKLLEINYRYTLMKTKKKLEIQILWKLRFQQQKCITLFVSISPKIH